MISCFYVDRPTRFLEKIWNGDFYLEVLKIAQSYTYLEYLVDTEWAAGHLDDQVVRIVESDEDILLYETGHIPGTVKVDWFTAL